MLPAGFCVSLRSMRGRAPVRTQGAGVLHAGEIGLALPFALFDNPFLVAHYWPIASAPGVEKRNALGGSVTTVVPSVG